MNIENYFESDEFVNSLKPLKIFFKENSLKVSEDIIEYFIGIGVKYSILFSGEDDFSVVGINQFFNKVVDYVSNNFDSKEISGISYNYELSKHVDKLYVEMLLEKLGLTSDSLEDENIQEVILSYITQKFGGKDYKFHAFNSAMYDSIKENGINPNVNFTSQKELDFINATFEKYGVKQICGWQQLNCKGTVSYSETPGVSYYYAINSPEWFGQFTGQGFPFNPQSKYNKSAFPERDYDAAKNNLNTLMNENNFTEEDRSNVLDFFEKNWKIYSNSKPMLAIIGESSEQDVKYWNNQIKKDKSNFDYWVSFFTSMGHVDRQTSDVIDTSNATFIKLPKLSQIVNNITLEENINMENNIEKLYDGNTQKLDSQVIFEKIKYLSQAKIKVKIKYEAENVWESEHGEEEVERVRGILKDQDVFESIMNNKFNCYDSMHGWISSFDRELLNKPENVKLIALKMPTYFSYLISEENRSDLDLMRECAAQKNIHPILTCYVSDNVKNDFTFVSNLIINSSEKTFDFYGESSETLEDSEMRYGKSVGSGVRNNPYFWYLLNAKIMSIRENSSFYYPLFDVDKELEIANREKENITKSGHTL